jgi:GTP diphosphokinase / guanosine-3',5'-bis(diphosphate) 3'-diphosphatase
MATVDRVLPWRRTNASDTLVAPVVEAYRERHAKGDAALIIRAYDSASEAHRDQTRQSGESYIHHPVAVAGIVASLGLDDVTIAAALLHDAVEDTTLTISDVDTQFGNVVASVVDGVTKLDRLAFDSKEAQQAATMRKMLVAMAKDWRVLIIKLADRLHNMRTVAAMPVWKQRRTAQETLDIYAPLAHRLGIQELRWQLEDLSFAVLHPKLYAEIDHMVAVRAPEREAYLSGVLDTAREHLERLGVEAIVTGRPKNLYSIYEKMIVKGKEFNEIYDLVGIRVLVESQKDCYAAIGAIHATWPPLPGRVKDYIATPKFNLYQSLHTTVVGPQGKPLEVQIRTSDMHRRAEFGIAAHWGYKEKATPQDIAWVQRFVDWQQDTTDPAEFLETLKLDLDTDEVYVFSPKGDIMTLPIDSVPVDFAYAIHTEVGHRCIGARINGRLARLDSKLASGDTVEIITSKLPTAGPSRDWLDQVASPRARNKIRQWFSRERRDDAIDNGRDELFKAMRREGLPVQKLSNSPMLSTIAVEIGHADLDALYAAIGENHVSAHSVAQRIARELRGGDHEEQLPTTARQERRSARKQHPAGVYVEGLDDVMVRLSKCCTPVPGDAILGFVTRGRGVSVHRVDCSNAATLAAMADSGESRLIEVEWDRESPGVFMVSIEVLALDRTKLLLDVSRVLSEHHINILGSATGAGADRLSRMRFDIELADPTHLETLLAAIKRVDSVYDAYRALPGRSG